MIDPTQPPARVAARGPRRRAALTLAEVLIAMGVLAIGLLGVAAVFPVGGFYMQSGDIADRAGMIAQLALEDAIIRGHLDPDNWVAHDVNFYTAGGPLTARPLPSSLRSGLNLNTDGLSGWNGTPQEFRASFYGGAYVIDPIGFATLLTPTPIEPQSALQATLGVPANSAPLRRFPATNVGAVFEGNTPSGLWQSWSRFGGLETWPVRRVTTTLDESNFRVPYSNNPTWSKGRSGARTAFGGDDDLALTLPRQGDNPARQQMTQLLAAGDLAAGRVAQAAYSWVLTVAPAAPSSTEARDAIATSRDGPQYDVSAAVFHKRSIAAGSAAARENERLVAARVVTTTDGGGELLLERLNDGVDASPFDNLRAGEFVMVVGPHPLSTPADPRLALRWCRVLTIDDDGQPRLPGGQNLSDVRRTLNPEAGPARDGPGGRVLVTLRGPDWPWRANGALDNTNLLANDLRVAIVPGVVAVHTKTMRLEGASEWAID